MFKLTSTVDYNNTRFSSKKAYISLNHKKPTSVRFGVKSK